MAAWEAPSPDADAAAAALASGVGGASRVEGEV